ncbi:MAG: magnesium chelatase domain-containing protein, partial [Eubacteriales bacterium]|nr:magnesium chelatase domain-containing protein [Eubacteriales bacterium]
MLSSVQSYGLSGIDGFSVQIQVDITNGLPACEVVGLPDAAVRESKERVRAAVRNSGFAYPMSRITVNLAPAGMKKEGAVYDLPIAIGVLAAGGQVEAQALEQLCIVGELALDGRVCPIDGVLPMVIDAYAHGYSAVAVPADNAEEAAYVTGVTVYPVPT